MLAPLEPGPEDNVDASAGLQHPETGLGPDLFCGRRVLFFPIFAIGILQCASRCNSSL